MGRPPLFRARSARKNFGFILLSFYFSCVTLSVCRSVSLSLCLSVSLSASLPVRASARLRACRPVRPSHHEACRMPDQRVACLTSVSGVGRQNDIQLRCAKCGDEAFWSNGQWDGRTRFHATASHIVRGIVLGWLLPTPPPSCGRARSSPPTVVCLFIGLSVCLSVISVLWKQNAISAIFIAPWFCYVNRGVTTWYGK